LTGWAAEACNDVQQVSLEAGQFKHTGHPYRPSSRTIIVSYC
jgi:hypothetical protein